MITLLSCQEALVAKLKTTASVTALIPLNEIREVWWQGTKFSYPNVRVRVENFRPTNTNCTSAMIIGSFYVFSDLASSYKAELIASAILLALHGKSFDTSGVKFTGMSCDQFGARRLEESNVWQSEVKFTVTVN